ncbi:hypothetical protein M8C21_005624 [Ambrosia artemisiifolia]|uniref:phosphoglycerate kinase n=1 Tax=Ambrosia artemisiifolia TaxID=4212 RepID=A0AAD5CT03_AMBAR|nr:hypothetical protein M8C21_005624 [Ambrosia artemisiifolia]
MAKKTSVSSFTEADLKGKRVFARVDLNVPLDDNFKIIDDNRIPQLHHATKPLVPVMMNNGHVFYGAPVYSQLLTDVPCVFFEVEQVKEV